MNIDSEKKRIAKLLKDGRISPAQAERLKNALPQKESTGSPKSFGNKTSIILLAGSLFAAFAVYNIYQHRSVTHSWFLRIASSIADRPAEIDIRGVLEAQIGSESLLLYQKGKKKLVLPLIHTDVQASLQGPLARVYVTQLFTNPTLETIEALYTFPLPENSAVDYMFMDMGDLRIRAVIGKRNHARMQYEEARQAAKIGALLEQERPDIFTQNVSGIMPKDSIRITISYLQEIKYRDGKFMFHFPMTIGPRYIPGSPLRPEKAGTANPTGEVPDAHRVTPPVLPPAWDTGVETAANQPEFRNGGRISLKVIMEAGAKLQEIASPSHRIVTKFAGNSTCSIELASDDRIPNKDFILEYTLSERAIQPLVIAEKASDNEGYFQLTLLPRFEVKASNIFPRELIFAADFSASMKGLPAEQSIAFIKEAMEHMRQSDTFRLLRISSSPEWLSEQPLPGTPANVDAALQFLAGPAGDDISGIQDAVQRIFDLPPVPGRKRLVIFLSDGFIGNEAAVLSTVRDHTGENRVFALGIGSSVNRHFIEGLALCGGGFSRIIRQDAGAAAAVKEFYETLDAPLLSNIRLDWHGIVPQCLSPARLPDLFKGQPLTLLGRYTKADSGYVIISGELPGNQAFSQKVDFNFRGAVSGKKTVATLWARNRIRDITLASSEMFGNKAFTPEAAAEHITALGLKHSLATAYTSQVAVLEQVRNRQGAWVSVEQPGLLPEGTDPAGFGASVYHSGLQRDSTTDAFLKSATGKNRQFRPENFMSGPAAEKDRAPYPSSYRKKTDTSRFRQDDRSPAHDRSSGSQGEGQLQPALPAGVRIISIQPAGKFPLRTSASLEPGLHKLLPALNRIFETSCSSQGTFGGQVVLEVELTPAGKAISVRVLKSDTGMKKFDLEIKNEVLRWRFDPADGSVNDIFTVALYFGER